MIWGLSRKRMYVCYERVIFNMFLVMFSNEICIFFVRFTTQYQGLLELITTVLKGVCAIVS